MGLLVINIAVELDLSKFANLGTPINFKLTFVCEGEPEPTDVAHYKFEIDTNGPGFEDLGNSRYRMKGGAGYANGNGGQILRAGVYSLDLVEIQHSSSTTRLIGGADFAKSLSSIAIPQAPGDVFKPRIAELTSTFGSVI